MAKLIRYDFLERRLVDCHACGGSFRTGRYREHVMNSKHPDHEKDRAMSGTELKRRHDAGKGIVG